MLMRISSKILLLIILTSCSSSITKINRKSIDSPRAKKAMIVSEDELASKAGLEILKKGGNAIDAAVAVGFALAVTYPEAGNLGGGGFMVIHLANGVNTTIDFRETAPSSASKNMYVDNNGNYNSTLSTKGWTSSGVPGTVAGLLYALNKYGTMSLTDVLMPAINLAENGFEIDYKLAGKISQYFEEFSKNNSSKYFVSENGTILKEGDILVQIDLAKTLKLILAEGRDGFYKGETAKLISEQSKNNGGYISIEDLGNYNAIEKEPVRGQYNDYDIISMGPSSSGGIALIQALNILENFNFEKDEWNSSKYINTVSEILKYVYADRSKHLGDNKFYNVPINELLSKIYAKNIADKISEKATPSKNILPGNFTDNESKETTHYNVLDEYKNAVSVTYTINSLFGNKIVVDGAGFFMNNEMDDFSSQPGIANQFGLIGGEANSIEPGKRMLSSMTPTIVLKNNNPYLLVGARGGSRIISAVLQTVSNVINFDMNINEAVEAPRFHHQWFPDKIDYEQYGLTSDVKNNLIARGQNLGEVGPLARVTSILIDSDGIIWGSADQRGEGLAIGY